MRYREKPILERLADEDSRKILMSVMDDSKTSKQISEELGIPLSSTYRKINALKEVGLLVVQRSGISENGNIHDLFRSAVTDIQIHLESDSISLDLTFNEDVYEKVSRIWRTLREAR